jgi:hypothetical protein
MRNTNIIRIKLSLKDAAHIDEVGAVKQIKDAISKLVKLGALRGKTEEFLRDYDVIIGPETYALVDILADAYVDGAPLPQVGAGVVFMDKTPDGSSIKETTRTYSQATINERLKVSKMDPRTQFRYLVVDYRRYFASHKKDLLDDLNGMRQLLTMFISDTSNMIFKMAPGIKEGKQLAALLAVQTLSPALGKVARDFSIAYKRFMAKDAKDGTPTPILFNMLRSKWQDFIIEVLHSVFPNVDPTQYGINIGGLVNNAATNTAYDNPSQQASEVSSGGRTFSFVCGIPTAGQAQQQKPIRTFTFCDAAGHQGQMYNRLSDERTDLFSRP